MDLSAEGRRRRHQRMARAAEYRALASASQAQRPAPVATPMPAPVFRLDGRLTPGSVIALQSAAGNAAINRRMGGHRPVQRLWGNKKKPTDDELRQLKQTAGHDKTTNKQDVNEAPESNTGEHIQEGLGFGAELTQVPGDTLSNFGGETNTTYGKDIAFTGERGQSGLSSAGSGLAGVGSGLTAVGGVVGSVLAVMKLRELARSTDPGKRWDQASTLALLVGSGASALVGGAQTVTGMVGMGGNAAAAAGKGAGEGVANAASGVMDSLGVLGGIVEVGVNTFNGALGVVRLVKGKEWDTELAGGIGMDFLKALKGVAIIAKSTISAANAFLQLAGMASAVLPIVGAAINIVAQMIDVLIQAVDMVVRVYKIVKAAIMGAKMKALEAKAGISAGMKSFAQGMALNAKKRWKRQIAPLIGNVITVIADFISVGGSVLNIVGAATAAAYGAGVGLMAGGYAAAGTAGALKVGAAMIKPAQSFVRWSKQKIRDKGQTNQKVKSVGEFMRIDMTRTTDKKNEEVAGQISFLMKHLHSLPALPQDPNDAAYAKAKEEYEEANLLVRSTGVKVKELTAASDANAVVKILAKAIRSRE